MAGSGVDEWLTRSAEDYRPPLARMYDGLCPDINEKKMYMHMDVFIPLP